MSNPDTQVTRPTAHRTGTVGRPNPLADPDFAQAVAEAFAAGLSRTQMCDEFGVKDKSTISRWRRDPRVKARALKIIEDRILTVTRRVDSVIEARLQKAEKMTVNELLAIRKEYLGGALRAQTEKADEETISEAMRALEENPDLVEGLDKLLSSGPLPGVHDAETE